MSWEKILKERTYDYVQKIRETLEQDLYGMTIGDIQTLSGLVEEAGENSDDVNSMMYDDMSNDLDKLFKYCEEVILEVKEYYENPLSEENPDGHEYRKEFCD
jgi:DNA-binding ferritin-like protein